MTAPARRTDPAEPVHLPGVFPPADAPPAAGCTRCDQLAGDRAAARAAGDLSAATDANIRIRRHPDH